MRCTSKKSKLTVKCLILKYFDTLIALFSELQICSESDFKKEIDLFFVVCSVEILLRTKLSWLAWAAGSQQILFHFCMFWCPLTFWTSQAFLGWYACEGNWERKKLGCNQSHAGEDEVDVGSSGALVLYSTVTVLWDRWLHITLRYKNNFQGIDPKHKP